MTRLEHTIVIERPRPEVYALARQVERYPDIFPGYVESRIIERRGDACLLQRAAVLEGHAYRWKSWVRFQEDKAIFFEQAEGPLKGMRVEWIFDALGAARTRVQIVHEFELRHPPLLGRWMERRVYAPRISRMAQSVVESLKQACETRQSLGKNRQETVV